MQVFSLQLDIYSLVIDLFKREFLVVDLNFDIILVEPTRTMGNTSSGGNAKRRKIPAWVRDELSRMEREKTKKMQNTSNNSLSMNDSSSVSKHFYSTSIQFIYIFKKFDDDDEEEENVDENENNDHTDDDDEQRTVFNEDVANEDDEDDDEKSSSLLVSSTPIVSRRSRFVGYHDWT
jgi:hypothetical protein